MLSKIWVEAAIFEQIMDTRSSRIQELRAKNELRCMWGLFNILESCEGHPHHNLISNTRRVDKHIIDYPRRSFDEECRRIQKEAGLRSVPIDARAKTSGNFDEENKPTDEHKSKRKIVNIREHIKMDSELNRVVKTQNTGRKSCGKAYQSHSTPAEISLKKLTLSAILEAAVCAQNHQEESKLSEYIQKSNRLGKSDKIVILKPAPRNAKRSENVTRHCSLLQDDNKSSRRISDSKTTSFSFREMKRKLKHTFRVSRKEQRNSEKLGQECICGRVDIRKSVNSSSNSEQKGTIKDVKSNMGSDIAAERKKLDFSSAALSNKKEFDVILEAKRHLSARLRNINSLEGAMSKKSPKTLQRVLSSPEHDFRMLSPRRESHYCCDSAQMRFSPYNTSLRATESSSQVSNGTGNARLSPLRSNTEAKACSPMPRTEEEVHDSDISATDDTKSNGESDIQQTDSILDHDLHVSEDEPSDIKKCDITRTTQTNDPIKPQKNEEVATHSTSSDSLSEIEAIKYHEEHQSPVSVLGPFFVEEAESPPSTSLQSARKQLQPRRLDFEECSFESTPHDPSISPNSYVEDEDHLTQYVQLLLEASNLNWGHLSQISYPPEELLHESLFDEVDLPPLDCYYDPKLLFDHINEVLMQMYKCHCCSPYWLPFIMPRIMSTPLVDIVLDEIMAEAEFYLLPMTEKRTLDQIVTKDVAKCRTWLDVRLDTERIVIDISDDVLLESILDIVLEFAM